MPCTYSICHTNLCRQQYKKVFILNFCPSYEKVKLWDTVQSRAKALAVHHEPPRPTRPSLTPDLLTVPELETMVSQLLSIPLRKAGPEWIKISQNFKQKSIATFQRSCFALGEKIWQSIDGRHPPTHSPLLPISSLPKHMLLINVPLFRKETKRFFNSLRCIGKQHFYNKSYCKRFLFGNLSLIDFKPGNKVIKC